MSHANLSRRSMLSAAASIAAVPAMAALPVLASAKTTEPAAAAALPVADVGPTPIAKLWVKREATRLQYEAARSAADRLKRKVARLMPKPHPSIVFSKENAIDGLGPDNVQASVKVHGFIWPQILTLVTPLKALRDMPFQGKRYKALRQRLAARLPRSRAYARKLKRLEMEIGLTAMDKKRDELCSRQVAIDNRIMAMRCTARSDFIIKFAIYDQYDREDYNAVYIARDVRRLVELPQYCWSVTA